MAANTASGSSHAGILSQVCALVVPSPLATLMARASDGTSLSRRKVPSSSRWYGSGSTMAMTPRSASWVTASAQPSSVAAVPVSASSIRSSILPPSRRESAMLAAS